MRSPSSPVAVDPETANLTDIKTELEEYHDSGRYEEHLQAMAALAEDCMLNAVAGVEQAYFSPDDYSE